MLFHHANTSDDQIAVTHHRLTKVELRPDLSALLLSLESWPNEAARLDGRAAAVRWHLVVPPAGLPFAEGLEAAVAAAVLASEQFAGATLIPDAADSLEGVQARRWASIKDERAARERATFEWGGHAFQVDQTRLTGAAVDAMAADLSGEPYEQAWVLADNSVISLTAAEQIAVGRACKAFISDVWTVSQILRAQIYAAEDVAAVAAVVWPI